MGHHVTDGSSKDTNQDHHPQNVPTLTYDIHDLYFNSSLTFLSVTKEIKHKHTWSLSLAFQVWEGGLWP